MPGKADLLAFLGCLLNGEMPVEFVSGAVAEVLVNLSEENRNRWSLGRRPAVCFKAWGWRLVSGMDQAARTSGFEGSSVGGCQIR